jgi:oxygen-independent coproporphyrinogen-3 oxidase
MSSAPPVPIAPTVQFDAQLVRKLSMQGPRYSSYPTADRFSSGFGYRDYLQAVAGLRTRRNARPLSIHLHIPFCETGCPDCGCDRTVGRNRDKAAVYLSYLKREIEMQGALFDGINRVEQLHLGGGTPTYLSDAQMADLMAHLRRKFPFAPDEAGEYSIEVDPRTVSPARVHSLRAQGFNHLSLRVADDAAGGSRAATAAIIGAARVAGFRSVGIDLVYGLPRQSVMGMAQALSAAIAAAPDRVAVHDHADLPGAEATLDMLELCVRRLTGAGYVYIGMDQFARPDDELAVAQRQGRLHRNFHGYSSHPDADLVACGVSAIGAVGSTYSQNVKTLEAYYERIDNNELPIERGIALHFDDLLRRALIQMLTCQFELSLRAIEQAFPIVFADYFAAELEQLHVLAAEGLLVIGPDFLSVTLRGRLLIGTVCMVFDRYMREQPAAPRYSHTV